MDIGIKGALRDGAKRVAITAALEAAGIVRSAGLMRDAGGRGAIFTLHHVRPYVARAFEPNRHLEITPEFLDAAIRRLKAENYVFVPIEALPALVAGPAGPRFAAFTLDDGNRNNAEHALPVFERHGVPFAVYVTQGFSERTHSMWWETLAKLIGDVERLSFDFGRGEEGLDLRTPTQKKTAFERFAAYMHGGDEAAAVLAIDALARRNNIEPLDIVASLVMDRHELKALAAHPLASLGAHTISHRAVGRLDDTDARQEMAASADYVAEITGARPATVTYPYGTLSAATPRDARLAGELGFSVGMTTRPGVVGAASPSAMTLLPRLSLNGYYQKARYASALASGIATRLAGKR